MKKKNISRRMFLKGAGGFTLAIPFLPSLAPRKAWAQSQQVAKRYFSFVGGYDYGHHQNWFPTLSQLSQTYNPGNGDLQIRYQALNSFVNGPNDSLSLILGNKLNPYLNKMNLLRGLNLHTRIAHGRGHMLGNIAATDGHDNRVTALKSLPTIDQVLATNRGFTPHSRDPLIVGYMGHSFRKGADGNVSQVLGVTSKPHQLMNLFMSGGQPLPENGGNPGTPAHPRRALLNRVMADFTRVRRGRKISRVDGLILDNVMDRYADILRRLDPGTMGSPGGCRYSQIDASSTQNDGVSNLRYYNPESHVRAHELYAMIFAAAASCDLHRVFGFHINIPEHFDRHPSEDFHQGHSHQPWVQVPGNGNKVNHLYMGEIWKFYVDSFLAKLLEELDSIQESNGKTILDNSLVHMTLESSTMHCDFNKPCLLIGSANGALTTGHFIDYSRRSLGPKGVQGDNFNSDPNSPMFGHAYYGAHYNRSLVTILQALGLNRADYEDPSINSFFRNRSDGLLGAQNNGISEVGGYGHIGASQSGVWYYTDAQLYSQEYSRQNYNFYKNSLPFPQSSAV